jgi:hypothetical protein
VCVCEGRGERNWMAVPLVNLLSLSSSELTNSGLASLVDEEKQPGSPKC